MFELLTGDRRSPARRRWPSPTSTCPRGSRAPSTRGPGGAGRARRVVLHATQKERNPARLGAPMRQELAAAARRSDPPPAWRSRPVPRRLPRRARLHGDHSRARSRAGGAGASAGSSWCRRRRERWPPGVGVVDVRRPPLHDGPRRRGPVRSIRLHTTARRRPVRGVRRPRLLLDCGPAASSARTSPPPGTRGQNWATRHIVESAGPRARAVPGVSGQTEAGRTTRLTRSGFGSGSTRQYSDSAAGGHRHSASPGAGTKLDTGERRSTSR